MNNRTLEMRAIINRAEPTAISTKKTAVLVGLFFLAATFTFAIGNAFINSYFSSATPHDVGRIAKQDTNIRVRRYAVGVLKNVAEMVQASKGVGRYENRDTQAFREQDTK